MSRFVFEPIDVDALIRGGRMDDFPLDKPDVDALVHDAQECKDEVLFVSTTAFSDLARLVVRSGSKMPEHLSKGWAVVKPTGNIYVRTEAVLEMANAVRQFAKVSGMDS